MINRRSLLGLIGLTPAAPLIAKALVSNVDLEKACPPPSECDYDAIELLRMGGDANTTAIVVAVPPSRRANPEERLYVVTVDGIYIPHRDSTIQSPLPDFQWWWETSEKADVYRAMMIIVPTMLASSSRVPVVKVY